MINYTEKLVSMISTMATEEQLLASGQMGNAYEQASYNNFAAILTNRLKSIFGDIDILVAIESEEALEDGEPLGTLVEAFTTEIENSTRLIVDQLKSELLSSKSWAVLNLEYTVIVQRTMPSMDYDEEGDFGYQFPGEQTAINAAIAMSFCVDEDFNGCVVLDASGDAIIRYKNGNAIAI